MRFPGVVVGPRVQARLTTEIEHKMKQFLNGFVAGPVFMHLALFMIYHYLWV